MVVDAAEFAEIEYTHAAADVYADNVGYNFLAKVARETNHAACPGMNVGHYADFLVGKYVYRD